jgi:hypothetical protein
VNTIGKTRLRISFFLLCTALAALVVTHATATVMEIWQERKQTPRLAADSMVKALRTYHRQTGRFPTDFRELEARVWKHKKPPDFGPDGRSLSIANYHYIYNPAGARVCTIWIIPTGPRRDEGATHFLLLYPENLRRWKGAPLSPDEVSTLPPVPQYRQMVLFGMTEQPQIGLARM